MDVENATRIDLGIGDDLADSHLAVIVHVIEIKLDDRKDAARHAGFDDQQVDRGARKDFTAQFQFGTVIAVLVKIDYVKSVEQIERILVF